MCHLALVGCRRSAELGNEGSQTLLTGDADARQLLLPLGEEVLVEVGDARAVFRRGPVVDAAFLSGEREVRARGVRDLCALAPQQLLRGEGVVGDRGWEGAERVPRGFWRLVVVVVLLLLLLLPTHIPTSSRRGVQTRPPPHPTERRDLRLIKCRSSSNF